MKIKCKEEMFLDLLGSFDGLQTYFKIQYEDMRSRGSIF